jgi:hypothetical protein
MSHEDVVAKARAEFLKKHLHSLALIVRGRVEVLEDGEIHSLGYRNRGSSP